MNMKILNRSLLFITVLAACSLNVESNFTLAPGVSIAKMVRLAFGKIEK